MRFSRTRLSDRLRERAHAALTLASSGEGIDSERGIAWRAADKLKRRLIK
jgi:hypothetical protein